MAIILQNSTRIDGLIAKIIKMDKAYSLIKTI